MASRRRLPEEFEHRLKAIEKKLQSMADFSDRLRLRLGQDATDNADSTKILRALEKSTIVLTPMIRQFLMENYRSSGLGKSPSSVHRKHTGWLIKMINATTVSVKVTASYLDKTLIPRYEITLGGPGATAEDIVRAAALNYGAVHTQRQLRTIYDPGSRTLIGVEKRAEIGEAAKRSLKKLAFTGRISKRALTKIQRGASFHGIQVTKGMNVTREGVHTKEGGRAIWLGPQAGIRAHLAFPFFFFTQRMVDMMRDAIQENLNKELGNAS